MRRVTFLLVVAGFALLAWLWTRQREATRDPGLHVYDYPLLEDLRPERVRRIRVDDLEQSFQLTLERDAAGSWFLTDPIAYPADDALVRKLLTVVARERGQRDALVEPAAAGLDPPRAVLLLDEVAPDGTTRERRVELGSPDVDPLRVYVRVPGHPASPEGRDAAILRVSRALSTMLARAPDEYREPRMTPFAAGQVRRFRRAGRVPPAPGGADEPGASLDLVATLEDGAWYRTDGVRVRLDPGAIGVLVRCAAELRVRQFSDDSPSDLARYGLDPPAFTIALETGAGDEVELAYGRRIPRGGGAARWYAKRADLENVWSFERTDAALLMRPPEALYDHQLVRVLRRDVRRVELLRSGATLAVEREGDGWRVLFEGAAWPADEGAVEELLAGLEQARAALFLPDVAFPEEAEGVGGTGFLVVTEDGARQGGRLGPSWAEPSKGLSGRLFQRAGEGATALVDEGLAALVATDADALRRLVVHAFPEQAFERVRLARGGSERVYVRVGSEWRQRGLELRAPDEVVALLRWLSTLRVEAWLAPGAEPAGPPVEVELAGPRGGPLRLGLGRLADGTPVCLLPGGAVGRVAGELVEGASRLFEEG